MSRKFCLSFETACLRSDFGTSRQDLHFYQNSEKHSEIWTCCFATRMALFKKHLKTCMICDSFESLIFEFSEEPGVTSICFLLSIDGIIQKTCKNQHYFDMFEPSLFEFSEKPYVISRFCLRHMDGVIQKHVQTCMILTYLNHWVSSLVKHLT